MAHQIMRDEMGLSLRRSRFLWQGYLYPLNFVVFEDPNKLGYYDHRAFQIGIHKKLMYLAKDEVLKNIIRHELAHLYVFLFHGKEAYQLQSHGREFHDVCKSFHWEKDVSRAYSDLSLENELFESDEEFEKVKSKIQKLMALSQSDNPNEAQVATAKANDYLIKYNLRHLQESEAHIQWESVMRTVAVAKKMNASMNGLYDILKYFHVQPIFNRKKEGVTLDVFGSHLNTEIADYMAKTLLFEFENLWKKKKLKDPKMKGMRAKNSYILGVAKGFAAKLETQHGELKKGPQGKALILLKKDLSHQFNLAFPRVSRQGGSSASIDGHAFGSGTRDGRNLNINPGLSQGNKGNLLT